MMSRLRPLRKLFTVCLSFIYIKVLHEPAELFSISVLIAASHVVGRETFCLCIGLYS